jgi:hypothetical protein
LIIIKVKWSDFKDVSFAVLRKLGLSKEVIEVETAALVAVENRVRTKCNEELKLANVSSSPIRDTPRLMCSACSMATSGGRGQLAELK